MEQEKGKIKAVKDKEMFECAQKKFGNIFLRLQAALKELADLLLHIQRSFPDASIDDYIQMVDNLRSEFDAAINTSNLLALNRLTEEASSILKSINNLIIACGSVLRANTLPLLYEKSLISVQGDPVECTRILTDAWNSWVTDIAPHVYEMAQMTVSPNTPISVKLSFLSDDKNVNDFKETVTNRETYFEENGTIDVSASQEEDKYIEPQSIKNMLGQLSQSDIGYIKSLFLYIYDIDPREVYGMLCSTGKKDPKKIYICNGTYIIVDPERKILREPKKEACYKLDQVLCRDGQDLMSQINWIPKTHILKLIFRSILFVTQINDSGGNRFRAQAQTLWIIYHYLISKGIIVKWKYGKWFFDKK